MNYKSIVSHYENCYVQHGDTNKGVDWPTKERAEVSYRIMLNIIDYHRLFIEKLDDKVSLLDFGCGLSHMYEYMLKNTPKYSDIHYTGLDISERFLEASKNKYPDVNYLSTNILEDSNALEVYDFIIMNGVFTEKLKISHEDMKAYLKKMIHAIVPHCRYGLAINFISKQVEWERNELFHLPMDELSWFLCEEVTRNFIIRNDYGEFAYTVYLFPTSKLV